MSRADAKHITKAVRRYMKEEAIYNPGTWRTPFQVKEAINNGTTKMARRSLDWLTDEGRLEKNPDADSYRWYGSLSEEEKQQKREELRKVLAAKLIRDTRDDRAARKEGFMKYIQVAVNFTVPDSVSEEKVTDFVDDAITDEASMNTYSTSEWEVDSARVIMKLRLGKLIQDISGSQDPVPEENS